MAESEDLKQRTARGFFWSLMGNGTQQFVTLLIGVALARILAVEDYALVAMLTVFGIIAGNLQESGFTSALAVREKAEQKDYNAVFWFSVLVSICIYAILFACAPLIARFNHAPQLTPLGRVLFLGFVCSSLGTAHTAYLFRHLMVRQKTTAQVSASILSGVVGLGMAIGGAGCWSLVAMDLTYKLMHTILVWTFAPWRPTLHIDLRPAFTMFGFSCKLLLTNLLNTFNNQLLQSVLGHYVAPSSVGHYSQANKWNTLGHSLLTGMVASVAQPVLARIEQDQQRQLRVFRKMLRFTALLAFPCMLGLGVTAPEFIPLLIGQKWVPCVPLLQILCVAGMFIPVNSVYSNLLISRSKSGLYLLCTSLFLLLQLVWLLCAVEQGMRVLLLGITTLTILWVFVWHAFVAREIGLTLRMTLTDLLPFAFSAITAVGAGWALAMLAHCDRVPSLIIKVGVAVPLYCLLMHLLRMDVYRECLDFVRRKHNA